jgi:hypothetical protein
MNWLQFASSLISSLAWPLVVIILVVIFRRQLAHLIGRIKSYKGMGQELTFGDRLADAENSVEEAVSTDTTGKTDPEQADEIEPNPLALEAEANPSFVVIRSYEQVASALSDLAGAAPQKVNPELRRMPAVVLRELQKSGLISAEMARAVNELRYLRNSVAHGKHNPTPGEAITYAESAQSISTFMLMKAQVLQMEAQVSAIPDDLE